MSVLGLFEGFQLNSTGDFGTTEIKAVLCVCVSTLIFYFVPPHSLAEDSKGVEDCRAPSLGLKDLLTQRAKELQGKEESQVPLLILLSISPPSVCFSALFIT